MSNNKQEQKSKIQAVFEISNIGPHISFNESLDANSLKLGIYANNGEGKTFVSRLFRLLEKPELNPDDSNNLLTLLKKSGHFRFAVKDRQSGDTAELKIDLVKDSAPLIDNKTKYIFHTFNSDYVKENIDALNYKPDANIEGYIIGKERIDLTVEKAKLEQYHNTLEDSNKTFKKASTKAQADVSNYVNKNLSEYLYLNLDFLLNSEFKVEAKDSYKENIAHFDLLKTMPINLPDIKDLSITIDFKVLDEISAFLTKVYTKSTLADDFLKKAKEKHNFVEIGTGYFNEGDKEHCPFCEQELTDVARKLILQYEEYLLDNESQVARLAKKLDDDLNSLKRNILLFVTEYHKTNSRFNEYRNYIPEYKNKALDGISSSNDEDTAFSSLAKLISNKKDNITLLIQVNEFEAYINQIKKWVSNTTLIVGKNNNLISDINIKKNNIDSVRKGLTREICKSRFIELRDEVKESIKKFYEIKNQKELLEKDIQERESRMRIFKKIRVTEVFTGLLQKFFGDNKYTLDESTYCLKFQNQLLEKNATKVLSEGEKGIIAFCYFLAEAFKYVQSEEDITNLFFIIDDPISSLDFHYVYVVSQILREINNIFKIERSRYLILTHNIEFMSILIRNNIVSDKWILSKGKLEELKNRLIMPYEAHLRDIYDVAKGNKTADHTTPNSIRHVLETLNQFISPDMEFNTFCNKKLDGFEANSFIYTLIHDNSHGGIRINRSYTDEMLKNGCLFVIDFLEKQFSGQITFIVGNN